MNADLAKLRALHEAAFQWPPKNLDAFADAMHEALPELLAIAEAVERARADIESIAAMMDYTDACEYAVELRAIVRLLTIGTAEGVE